MGGGEVCSLAVSKRRLHSRRCSKVPPGTCTFRCCCSIMLQKLAAHSIDGKYVKKDIFSLIQMFSVPCSYRRARILTFRINNMIEIKNTISPPQKMQKRKVRQICELGQQRRKFLLGHQLPRVFTYFEGKFDI